MKRFFTFGSTHPDVGTVVDEIISGLEQAPRDANVGFIYVTDLLCDEFDTLLQRCKSVTGIRHWVGTTGVAIIHDDREIYDQPAASVMLARFPEEAVCILPSIEKEEQLDDLPEKLDSFATCFGLVHGDPLNPLTQELIEELQSRLENGFLAGGLTSSRDSHPQVADNLVSGGISGILFSEKVAVQTNLTQGCSPLGGKHRITRSKENIAFSLDDRPALEVLLEDAGIAEAGELTARAVNLFAGLCLAGSDKSDYNVRNLMGVDPDNKLFAINDYLTEGEELLFCTRSEEAAEQDMRQMLEKLASRLEGTPKGGIYISCLGRGREQFSGESREVRMIHEILGDFPLTGFFANGEIHHGVLYGYTGVLVLFS